MTGTIDDDDQAKTEVVFTDRYMVEGNETPFH